MIVPNVFPGLASAATSFDDVHPENGMVVRRLVGRGIDVLPRLVDQKPSGGQPVEADVTEGVGLVYWGGYKIQGLNGRPVIPSKLGTCGCVEVEGVLRVRSKV